MTNNASIALMAEIAKLANLNPTKFICKCKVNELTNEDLKFIKQELIKDKRNQLKKGD